MASVKYDMGLNAAGAIVHISDAERGARYACAGCRKRLVAKMGAVNAHHFAHYAAEDGAACEPGDTIHNLAVQTIADAHAEAWASGRDYWLRTRCRDCERADMGATNLAVDFGEALVEEAVVCGTRSDAAFVSDDRTLIIEVIVTHPPEATTLALYAEAGVELYTVTLAADDWQGVADLRGRVLSDQRGDRCASCEDVERERREWARREDERTEASADGRDWARRQVAALRGEKRHSFTPPREIDRAPDMDEFRALSDKAQRFAFVSGRTLGRMGFRQTESKPWLFKRSIGDSNRRLTIWARMEYLLEIRVRFFTCLRFDRCRNGHSGRGFAYPENGDDGCLPCVAMDAADSEIAGEMERVYEILMANGRDEWQRTRLSAERESAARRRPVDDSGLRTRTELPSFAGMTFSQSGGIPVRANSDDGGWDSGTR